MQNLKIICVLAITLILSSMSGAIAQTRIPGVAVGNTFKYTYTFEMNVDNSKSETILTELLQTLIDQTKNIDSAQVTITDVSGTKVTMQTVLQFKNGTQQSNTGVTDVSTGIGDSSLPLIAANLTANDPIYDGNDYETINETITQTTAFGERQVNHQSITMNYDVSEEELSGFGITGPLSQTNAQNTYWDKQTGMLVEMSYKMQSRSEQINADISIDVVLVDSNVYTIPEYPTIIMVFAALAVSTVAVVKVRFGKKQ